uniref:THAP-type domain-containing protein n=1 Tax=Oryzias sinensis TaxID=183150 RepID=A0A8C7WWD5_9TELE
MPSHAFKKDVVSFYQFLQDKDRKRWIAAVKREGWLPTDASRLCSDRFLSGRPVVTHFLFF